MTEYPKRGEIYLVNLPSKPKNIKNRPALVVSLDIRNKSLEHARTIAMTTMVLFQFFQAWNSRSEMQSIFLMNPLGNPFLFYSMVAAFLAQIAVIYVPALQWVFRTEALTAIEWLRIAAVAIAVIVAVEIDKFLRRRSGP